MADDPDPTSKILLPDTVAERRRLPAISDLEPRFLHRKVSTRYPNAVTGRHLAFGCIADDGGYFYCKEDRNGHSVRATEWLATRLARHVGIATADCAILEDDDGTDYFGSRQLPSIADRIALENFLATPRRNELGQPDGWPGQHLAMLRAFDLFVDNPDRGIDNFVLIRDGARANLCAIDFGSARLLNCSIDRFPVESERTMFVGKFHQQIHGAHLEAAAEMLGRLAAIPVSIVKGFIMEMPEGWMADRQKGEFNEFWSDGRKEKRIANLRASLGG